MVLGKILVFLSIIAYIVSLTTRQSNRYLSDLAGDLGCLLLSIGLFIQLLECEGVLP